MYAGLPACLLGSGWRAARSEIIKNGTMVVNNDVYMALDANSSYVQLVYSGFYLADVRNARVSGPSNYGMYLWA